MRKWYLKEIYILKDKNDKTIYTRKEYEVDFVANKGNKKYYIQFPLSINDDNKLKQESNSIVRKQWRMKKNLIELNQLFLSLWDGE